MLVCKFEINWSTNKNLRALTTYLGRTDARHFHIPRSVLRGRETIKYYIYLPFPDGAFESEVHTPVLHH